MAAIHHIAIGARDVEAVAGLYREVFEATECARHEYDDGTLRSIWLEAGGATLMIERTERFEERVEGVGAGLFLVAFEVEAQERARLEERLEAAGSTIEERTRFSSYARDPEGNRVAVSHHPDPPDREMRRRLEGGEGVE